MYKEIIVTLYEKAYHYGVAGLANSLAKSGFKGLLLVGYKGSLPPWINQLHKKSENEFILTDTITIKFDYLDLDMHFGYYKPNFIKSAFKDYPAAERVYYFDPDIVVIAPWSFYSAWVKSGVALCLDNAFPFVYHNHPWRNEWRELAARESGFLVVDNNLNYYINSGFIGTTQRDVPLLDKWISLTTSYKQSGGDVSKFEKDGHRAYKGDQDLLNAAMTVCPDVKLSIIGAEGMGFSYPYYLMLHAVEGVKPWDSKFSKNVLLRGKKPTGAAKGYFDNCQYPIAVYPKGKLRLKKLDIKIASALGRILG